MNYWLCQSTTELSDLLILWTASHFLILFSLEMKQEMFCVLSRMNASFKNTTICVCDSQQSDSYELILLMN